MIKKKIRDVWFIGLEPSTLSVNIQYSFWIFTWCIVKTAKVKPNLTMKEMMTEANELLLE